MKILVDRKTPPPLKSIEQRIFSTPEAFHLKNGIPVFVFASDNVEIVKIDLLFSAGMRYQPKPFVASYTAKMLSEGTASYSAPKIAEIMDYYGAGLSQSVTKDTAVITLSALTKHFLKILPVFHEIIHEPIFPEKELSVMIENGRQEFIDNSRKVNEVAARYFQRQLYGSQHPYGTFATAEDFDSLNRELLKNFFEENYASRNFTMIVSGKVTKKIMDQLDVFFGQKRIDENKPSEKLIKPQYEKLRHTVKMNDVLQSAIRVGKTTINKSHSDFPKLFILNTLLGGYFGSRLMKNIREEKGYTYGIYSVLLSYFETGAFYVTSEVRAQVCNKALKEIYKEIKRLRTEPIPLQELETVRNYLTGSLLRSFDGPFNTSERFLSLLGYPVNYEEYYTRFIKILNTITPDELRILAENYLHEDSMIELVVGKRQ